MTAFRLTLDVDEETRARWQHAADRAGFTLDEWIREYLDAASDPDSGQVSGTGTPGAQQTQSDNAWVPHEDVIRERLQFDLDQIRGITGHMPRDVAMDYESTATAALTALDSFLGRLTTAEQERDAWHLRATQEITRADEAEARVEAAERERVVQATLALTRKMSRDIAYRKIAAVEAILADDSIFCTERVDRARAALACPPQQPQKAGEPPAEVSSFTMLSESELLEAEAALQRPTPDREENEPPVKVAREPGPTPQESLRLTPEGEHTSPAACPPPESSQG